MSYDLDQVRSPFLRRFLKAVFDTTDGHDHDGTNSKSLSPAAVVADDSINAAKIQSDAVIEAKILNGAVTVNKLGAKAVETAKIDDLAVDTAQLAADAVETAKINNLAVNAAKLGAKAVETAKIDDLAVEAGQIGAKAVITAKIDDLAVDTAQIAASAVETAKINNLAVNADKLAANAVTHEKILANAVRTAGIQDDAITSGKIGDSQVIATKIAANAVTAVKFNADVVGEGVELNGVTNKIDLDVDDSTVEVDSTDGLRIKALGVDTAQLAADAVETAKIADDNVTGAKIANSVVKVVTVDIPNAEIKALNATPKELVAAPGANKMIELVSATLFHNYGSEVLTGAHALTIGWDNGTVAAAATVAEGDFAHKDANYIVNVQPALETDGTSASVFDKNLALTAAGDYAGNSTGDTVWKATVVYRVLDFA